MRRKRAGPIRRNLEASNRRIDQEDAMKISKRPADERGHARHDWLDSRFSFSFADYHDPAHMGFHALRVINDDWIEPGRGFGQHPHRDAEILTYVLEGQLQHRDSMGNGSVIPAGDLQYMSAGSGVTHSEFNPSGDERTHLLQIWILPDKSGGAPRYAEKHLGTAASPNALTLLFAGKPRDGAVGIRADADVYVGKLDAGQRVAHRTSPGRGVWLHQIAGTIRVGGETLDPGDGAAIEDAEAIDIESRSDAEFLLFDLA
jgi:redox-sensitive bicupin YhaK (pirin superfamily)